MGKRYPFIQHIPGAEYGSDHEWLIACVQVRLRKLREAEELWEEIKEMTHQVVGKLITKLPFAQTSGPMTLCSLISMQFLLSTLHSLQTSSLHETNL